MGFISPHGLHIPIVTITRNNLLLVRHICDIGNQFPGVEFDWHGATWMMNIWSTVSSWYRKFYCDNDFYCLHASNYAGSLSLWSIFSLLTQISISSHFYCELTSLQQVIYSKPNSAKLCFTRNWRYLTVNLYCNTEYHASLTGLMHIFEKTWSDNRKHISDVYILTVIVHNNMSR